MMLTDDDLAYMRETQAEHRPTEAVLLRRVLAADPFGGQEASWAGPGVPVNVRIDGTPDDIPPTLGDRLDGTTPVKITLDLVSVRDGDRVQVTPSEVYEVVSEGDPDRWATAQVVWAHRITWPDRG